MKKVLITLLFVVIAGIGFYFFYQNSGMGGIFGSIGGSLKAILSGANNSFTNEKRDLPVKYKFAILADTHEDVQVFPKIVDEISQRDDLEFVAHLGDLSNAGERNKLAEAKSILDQISVPVHVIPGDHDLNWIPKRDLTNFLSVFGLPVTTYGVEHDSQYFVFIDNSDSQNGIPENEMQWIKSALESHERQDIYVFMSTPLSNPYLGFKTMGSQSDEVKNQAKELSMLLAEHNVRAIFAGDTHTFSQYEDVDSGIPVVTVGAAGSNKNPLPLYVVVEILSDGSYNATSVPLQ